MLLHRFMAVIATLLRRFMAVIAMLLIGSIGLFFAMKALSFSGMVLSAVWTGVFQRPDFREDTGDVRILRASDPDWFWGNVEFYTFVSVVFLLIAVPIILPLVIYIKHCFRTLFSNARE